MKKIGYFLIIVVCSISFYNCSEDDPVATTTVLTTALTTITYTSGSVAGVGSLPPGVNGSIQNTRVALYASVDDWLYDRAFKFGACDGSGNYNLPNVTPGVFYMDAWKDNDNNQVWGSSGDYVWVNGSGVYPNYTLAPLQVTLGPPTSVNFQVFVVP